MEEDHSFIVQYANNILYFLCSYYSILYDSLSNKPIFFFYILLFTVSKNGSKFFHAQK